MPTYRSNILIFSELVDAEIVKWLVIDIGVKSNKKRSKQNIQRLIFCFSDGDSKE